MLHTKADVNQVVLNVLYNKQTGILLSWLHILLEGGESRQKLAKYSTRHIICY